MKYVVLRINLYSIYLSDSGIPQKQSRAALGSALGDNNLFNSSKKLSLLKSSISLSCLILKFRIHHQKIFVSKPLIVSIRT